LQYDSHGALVDELRANFGGFEVRAFLGIDDADAIHEIDIPMTNTTTWSVADGNDGSQFGPTGLSCHRKQRSCEEEQG
jgi:hypothetical protein